MKKNNLVEGRDNTPLVSVVMPVYNAEKYVRSAIESVIQQSYKQIELIIVDDVSTDNSWKIIQMYEKHFSCIRAIRMSRNLNRGGDMCANEGIKLARGKYIARMDADDICHLSRIEKQVAYLEAHPDIFLVGSNAHVIDRMRNIIGEKIEPSESRDIYRAYFTIHPIIHPSSMFRRVYQDKKFSYEIRYSANNDYFTFFKLLCKNYRFANLKEKLLYYRIHGKNDTFVNVRKKFLNTLAVRIEMFLKHGYDPTFKQVAVTLAQAAATLLLPQRVSTHLYLLVKGIIKFDRNPLKMFGFFTRPKLEVRAS